MTTEDSKTPSLREAAQLALDALRMPCDRWNGPQAKIVSGAIKDLTAALAVPDEPVAWQSRYICPDEGPSLWMDCKKRDTESLRRSGHEIRALCVESQPDHGEAALDMVRRPLTGEQKETLWRSATLEHTDMCSVYLRGYARRREGPRHQSNASRNGRPCLQRQIRMVLS